MVHNSQVINVELVAMLGTQEWKLKYHSDWSKYVKGVKKAILYDIYAFSVLFNRKKHSTYIRHRFCFLFH